MTPLGQSLVAAAVLLVAMTAVWLVQRRTRNAGIVDVAWTFGVGFLAVFYALTSGGTPTARLLTALVGGAWALRLGTYLARRVIGQEEDGRYRALRDGWGAAADRNLLLFFHAQALASMLLGLSFQVVAWNRTRGLDGLAFLGLAIAIVSLAGEAIADRQLERFKANPANRGRTCCEGLWRYSRHPNYFFEWLHWWAYVPLAAGGPWSGLSLLAPMVMLVLLYRVTGIPATERRALATRGEDYRRYQRQTSAFLPWFPREEG